jgi:membrane protease YdiL (CAAX protease family)
MRRANPSQQFFAAPALVLAISIFMIFVQFANLDTDNEAVIYGVMLILQIVVFAVPTGFFCYLRGKKYIFTLDIYAPRKHSFRVIVLGSLLVILASGVLKFGLFHFAYDYSVYSLYGSSITLGTGSFGGTLLMVLSLAVLPALTEELVFRGIIMNEYKQCGSVCSMLFSAVLFAFVHFDLRLFPIYVALGMLIAWMVFITRSVWSAVIVHTVYNIYVIFFEKYIWLFSSNPDSDILFWLILTAAMFVCAFFFLGAAENVMRHCAENGDGAPKPIKKLHLYAMLKEAVMEKPFLAEVALFVIVSIIVM